MLTRRKTKWQKNPTKFYIKQFVKTPLLGTLRTCMHAFWSASVVYFQKRWRLEVLNITAIIQGNVKYEILDFLPYRFPFR